jgi:hypothetical protein
MVSRVHDFPALQCRAKQNKVPLGLRREPSDAWGNRLPAQPWMGFGVLAGGFNPGKRSSNGNEL